MVGTRVGVMRILMRKFRELDLVRLGKGHTRPARAREIIKQREPVPAVDEPAPDWRCPQCGEELEGTYHICWNCESPRPKAQDSPDSA